MELKEIYSVKEVFKGVDPDEVVAKMFGDKTNSDNDDDGPEPVAVGAGANINDDPANW